MDYSSGGTSEARFENMTLSVLWYEMPHSMAKDCAAGKWNSA